MPKRPKLRPADRVAINLPPSFKDRGRGISKGKGKKVTLEVTTKPVVLLMDTYDLEEKAAKALTQELKKRIKRVTRPVKVATIERRQRYLREFQAGKKTAVRRYKGSARAKIGATPPITGEQSWLTDSGRLAKSLAARFNRKAGKTGGWTINVAGNRLNSHEFDDDAGRFTRFLAVFDKLVSIKDAVRSKKYKRALEEGYSLLVHGLRKSNAEKRAELRREYGKVFGSVLKTAFGA